MRTLESIALALALGVTGIGCAPPEFHVHTSFAGVVDVGRDRAAMEKAQEMEWEGDHGITVYQDALPDGLSVKEGKLEIAPEYASRYRLVGTIRTSQGDRTLVGLQAAFLYPPFHSSVSRGRDVYCKVQTPLRLLTLAIWSVFVPFNWPCFVGYSDAANDNMEIHVGEIRRATAAMGADIAVIGSIDDRKLETVSVMPMGRNTYAAWVTHSTIHAATVEAFAVAVDGGASLAKAPSGN